LIVSDIFIVNNMGPTNIVFIVSDIFIVNNMDPTNIV
jgi:hypothetical protein